MAHKVGGVNNEKPVTADVIAIVNQVKDKIEEQIHAKLGAGSTHFEPKTYKTQVVAGTNYFVKIDIGSREVHARIFKDLQQHVSLHSIQIADHGAELKHF
eukprot:TRINITY_DN1415_c0_g1_i1.p1 TRINITY_DN1415_c0_g1~~TRINITY_DN1415_c0_g1_i1.p1  ORF type:complete len:115 (-),score=45.30 TRINITY_DN1415_c0_g1_i1:110-409(-)